MTYLHGKKLLFGDWQDVTGVPERDALICAMGAIEQREGERRGWDKPPRAFTMHLANMDSRTVEMRELPRRAWAHGLNNPADEIERTAAGLPQPPAVRPDMSFADAPDGIAAVAFMVEGWGVPQNLERLEDQVARAAGRRNLHTNPDRWEIRTVNAVDINGWGYVLMRIRGQGLTPVTLVDRELMLAPANAGPGKVARSLFRMAWAARTQGWPYA
jgi:hypothetical protein